MAYGQFLVTLDFERLDERGCWLSADTVVSREWLGAFVAKAIQEAVRRAALPGPHVASAHFIAGRTHGRHVDATDIDDGLTP